MDVMEMIRELENRCRAHRAAFDEVMDIACSVRRAPGVDVTLTSAQMDAVIQENHLTKMIATAAVEMYVRSLNANKCTPRMFDAAMVEMPSGCYIVPKELAADITEQAKQLRAALSAISAHSALNSESESATSADSAVKSDLGQKPRESGEEQ